MKSIYGMIICSVTVLLALTGSRLGAEEKQSAGKLTKAETELIDQSTKLLEKHIPRIRKVLQDKGASMAEKEKAVKQIERIFLYYPDSTRGFVPGLSEVLTSKDASKKTKDRIIRIFSRMRTKSQKGVRSVLTYMKNDLQKPWDRWAVALLVLADMDPQNTLVAKETPGIMERERLTMRYLAAIRMLDMGKKSDAVISLVAEGTGIRLEFQSILAIARNAGRLTKDEKQQFIEALGKPVGNNCKSNIKYYCIYKLKGDMATAIKYYKKAMDEKSLLAIVPWGELPRLPKSEIRALTPVIIEGMKRDKNSARMLSLSFLLKEAHRKEEGETGASMLAGKPGTSTGKNSAEKAVASWLRAVADRNTKTALAQCRLPVLFAERDLRMKDGKPIRSGIWDVTVFDKKTLPGFIEKISGKIAKLKLESSAAVTAKGAAVISKELGKCLPKGGFRVIAAEGRDSDCVEFFVNPDGKIVALFGSER